MAKFDFSIPKEVMDDIKTIYDNAPVTKVKELTGKEYMPYSLTPLYDAMGQSLNALRRQVASDDKVLVTIITDGEENSSSEYDSPAIKALVEELKEAATAVIGSNNDDGVAKWLEANVRIDA